MGSLLLLLLLPLCGRVVVERGRAGGGSRTWCKYLRHGQTSGTLRFTWTKTTDRARLIPHRQSIYVHLHVEWVRTFRRGLIVGRPILRYQEL